MAKALLGIALWLCVASTALPAAPSAKNPSWAHLTGPQQSILAPLKEDWDKLDVARKQKWLGIARRYPDLKPDEQARVQQRMKDWASLTPEQRRAAREKYKEFEQLPAEEKQAVREKWQKYQEARGDKKGDAPVPAPRVAESGGASGDTTSLKP